MKLFNKKLGIGSISLLLYIMGVLFGSTHGDRILKFIGLNSWFNGNSGIHYAAYYSLLFFIIFYTINYCGV